MSDNNLYAPCNQCGSDLHGENLCPDKSSFAAPSGSPATCACVHHDGYECARIRDGRHMPDDDDYHKRCCECDCHETEDFYEEDI